MKRLVIIISMFIVGSMVGSGYAASIPTLAWPSDTKVLKLPFGYLYSLGGGRHTKFQTRWRDSGIDIAAPANSPVYAADGGIVKDIILPDPLMHPMGSVIIEHTGVIGVTYTTYYYGVVGVLPAVGHFVSRGEYIATVQDMGLTTALHFGVRNAPYDNSLLAGTRSLPSVAAYGLPAFPENYIDPVSILPP